MSQKRSNKRPSKKKTKETPAAISCYHIESSGYMSLLQSLKPSSEYKRTSKGLQNCISPCTISKRPKSMHPAHKPHVDHAKTKPPHICYMQTARSHAGQARMHGSHVDDVVVPMIYVSCARGSCIIAVVHVPCLWAAHASSCQSNISMIVGANIIVFREGEELLRFFREYIRAKIQGIKIKSIHIKDKISYATKDLRFVIQWIQDQT